MKAKDVGKWLVAAGAATGAALGIYYYYLTRKKPPEKPPVVQPPETIPSEEPVPQEAKDEAVAKATPVLDATQDLKALAPTLGDNRLNTLADAVEKGVSKAVDDVNKSTIGEEFNKAATVLDSVTGDLILFIDFVRKIKELLETVGKEAALKYIEENIGRVVDATGAVLQEFELPGGDVLKAMLESGVVEHVKGDKAAAWVIVAALLKDVTKPYLYMNVYGPKYDDRLGKEVYLDSNAVSGTSVGPASWGWYQVEKTNIGASIGFTLNGFSKSFSPEVQVYIPTVGIVDRITMKQVELPVACAFVKPCESATRGLEFLLPDEYTADEKVFGGLKFTLSVNTTGELILVPEAWADPASNVWEWTDETKSEIVEKQVTATQVERYEVTYRKFRRWKIRVTIPSQTLTVPATTGDVKMGETWYEVYSGGVTLGVKAEYIPIGEVWAVDSLKLLEGVAPEESKRFHVVIRKYDDQYRLIGEYPWAGATITLRFTDGRVFTAVTDSNGYATLQGDVPTDVIIDYLEVSGTFEGKKFTFRPDGWSGNRFLSTGTIELVFSLYPAAGLFQLIVETDFGELGARVVVEPDTISQITYGLRYYSPGDTVKLTSIPPSGYKFVKWTIKTWRPDGSSTTAESLSNPLTITMDYHKAVHAVVVEMTEEEKKPLPYEEIGQVPEGTPGAVKLVVEGENVWPPAGTYWFKQGSNVPLNFGPMQYATIDGEKVAIGGNQVVWIVMNTDHYVKTWGAIKEAERTSIDGYILLEDTGKPVAGLKVGATEAGTAPYVGGGVAYTNDKGYFVIGGPLGAQIIVGRYYDIIVEKPPSGYFGGRVKTYVLAGTSAGYIFLKKIPPPATVEGFVLDKNNKPFPGLQVGWYYGGKVLTDENGYFKVTGYQGMKDYLVVNMMKGFYRWVQVWGDWVTPPDTLVITLKEYSAP
jgi:hypothetical protein